jgi:dTMP kinase
VAEAAPVLTSAQVYKHLLRDHNFSRLFYAMLTSSVGDWLGVLAIIALTESLIGQGTRAAAFAVSGVMVARVLPTLFLGPIAGVFVDRWDRKRTLIWVDVGRGILMVALAFSGRFLELFLLTLFVEILSTMFAPARDATIPNIVDRKHLVQANQLTLFVTYGTLPIGGILYALITGFATTFLPDVFAQRPEVFAILLNALTFFVSAPLLLGMRIPRGSTIGRLGPDSDMSTWGQLKEGFEFVFTHPKIKALVWGVMAAAFAAGVLFAVGKLFVSVVGAGQTGWGLLVAATGVGMAGGLFAAGWLSSRYGKDRIFAPGVGVGGAAAAITALMPRAELAAFWALVLGAGAGVAFVAGYTLIQQATDDEIRGRAFAAFHTGVRAALFVALVAAPFAVGVIGQEPIGGPYRIGGVRITMIVGGLVAVAGAIWCGRQMIDVDRGGRATIDDIIRAVTEVMGPQRTGLFVVFEGGEGAGKSTQTEMLCDALEEAGLEVRVTREPGGTEVGEQIRRLLLDPESVIDARTEALLHAAVRAQHVEQVVKPALEHGHVVISDRYVDSSIVYQGVARGLGASEITELNRWGTEGLVPDLVVVLDVRADEGLSRVADRGDANRYEDEDVAFHEKVNEAFRRRAEEDPGRYLVIDASEDPETIHEKITTRVLQMLGREVGFTTAELKTISPEGLGPEDAETEDESAARDAHGQGSE